VKKTNKQLNFCLALAALSAACCISVATARAEVLFTSSLHLKEGVFALRAEKGLIVVMRADDRAGRSGSLRVRVVGSSLVIPLRRLPAEHAPWRYVSEAAGWNGDAKKIELEASDDNHVWRLLGIFERD